MYTRTTSGTNLIFSADVWISDDQVIFQYKPGACIPLAIASKNTMTK